MVAICTYVLALNFFHFPLDALTHISPLPWPFIAKFHYITARTIYITRDIKNRGPSKLIRYIRWLFIPFVCWQYVTCINPINKYDCHKSPFTFFFQRREKRNDVIYNPIKWALGRTKDICVCIYALCWVVRETENTISKMMVNENDECQWFKMMDSKVIIKYWIPRVWYCQKSKFCYVMAPRRKLD